MYSRVHHPLGDHGTVRMRRAHDIERRESCCVVPVRIGNIKADLCVADQCGHLHFASAPKKSQTLTPVSILNPEFEVSKGRTP
jgi:hypothetical protein